MIVLDASAAVEILLRLDKADRLMDRVFNQDDKLYAPQLLDVEVAQVIRRFWKAGDISAVRGGSAISDLAELPVERVAHTPLLERMWQLRNNVTAYDAAYIALAEALDSALVTCDSALGNVPGVRARVEVF